MAEIDDVVFQRSIRTEILVVAAVGAAARRVVDVLAVQLTGQSVGTGRYPPLSGTVGATEKNKNKKTFLFIHFFDKKQTWEILQKRPSCVKTNHLR